MNEGPFLFILCSQPPPSIALIDGVVHLAWLCIHDRWMMMSVCHMNPHEMCRNDAAYCTRSSNVRAAGLSRTNCEGTYARGAGGRPFCGGFTFYFREVPLQGEETRPRVGAPLSRGLVKKRPSKTHILGKPATHCSFGDPWSLFMAVMCPQKV